MRVGIVAGEVSGDILGGALVAALQRRFPEARFCGIGGPQMAACGLSSLYPMESISLMGTEGLLSQAPKIFAIRRNLYRRFVDAGIDLFIGVDVPDFNLGLEERLHRRGIPTLHYVSPTVWAWRGYRIRKIARAVSHVLTLFPFEVEYYRRHGVAATFVGHPLAREIAALPARVPLRAALGLPAEGVVVALLPGSRDAEVRRLARVMVETAALLQTRKEGLYFIAPMVSEAMRDCFLEHAGDCALPLQVLLGRSREALAAADVALLASGTAALEAMLLETPMVVTYRAAWISGLIARLLSNVRYYSMPNHLLARTRVPELLLAAATPARLSRAVLEILADDEYRRSFRSESRTVRESLAAAGIERAVGVVEQLLLSGSAGAGDGRD